MNSEDIRKPRKVFLTGRPGSGKTTAVLKTVERLGLPAHGFCTRELRKNGRRVGFEIADLEGNSAVMAHVDLPKDVRVSRYGVDISAIKQVGVCALRRAVREGTMAVLDEVGKMELSCPRFADAVQEVLEADIPVLGTIAQGGSGQIGRIKRRPDVEVWEVTRQNRDELPERLTAAFRSGRQ